MEELAVTANGGTFNVLRAGRGAPLLLLHGWPEFCRTWEPVMTRLADRFTLLAPDLRGSGRSSKPAGPQGAPENSADMLALLDALGIGHIGVVGHDVGGGVMQQMARDRPERLTGLFFFDFVYPGIGPRMGTPDRLGEIWYQSFHTMPMAPALVGASRDSCRTYIGHFLRHWAYRQDAFPDDVVEMYVDNFMAPGNLEGGFSYYKANQPGRLAMLKGEAPRLPPIAVPTAVRWAEHDPLFPFAWTDRLGETFTELDLAMFEGVGHFPHREDPDRAAAAIAAFFAPLASTSP